MARTLPAPDERESFPFAALDVSREAVLDFYWPQFFLKFVLSHPAVTCVIPATATARHMQDNCAGGFEPLPDEKQRSRMADYWAQL